MLSGNFHTHTVFCDGKNTAREMAEKAMELGFTHLGFSGHMDSEIRMDLAAYNAEIGRLQDLYRGRMEILRGVELDLLYTPQGDEEAALLRQMEYLIGSVHYVEAGDGTLIAVDDSAERLTKCFIKFCRITTSEFIG
jgi:histidinol-phosphatase (PHP family)